MKKPKTTHESKTANEFPSRIREHAQKLHCDDKLPRKKRLGVLKDSGFKLTEAFFEPLPEEELKLWEGEGE